MRSALVVVALAACGPSRKPDKQVVEPTASKPPREPADIANDLSLLATGIPATTEDLATLKTAGFSREAFDRYIKDLIQRPEVGKVASGLLHISGGAERNVISTPRLQEAGGVLYLHQPCDPSEAVTVKPWWDLGTTVRVCPAAYRPEVFHAAEGNYCSGVFASPRDASSPCGCGPNLMRCIHDEADRDALKKAIVRESRDTISWVISHDLPLQTIFTSPESFRTPHSELLYQRWLVENRTVPSLEALPDWRAWPKDGQWAPRPASKPDEHAGIFTNHFTPQIADSQRLKMSVYLEILWCQTNDSLRVKTSEVLDIVKHSGANLRSSVKVGPGELATRPLCGDCHAKIDYGVQFFAGIQWHYKALHYVADKQTDAVGEMYGRNIQDLRGRAKRNPQGFVSIALAQPEFPACMARDFLVHAFGSSTDPSLQPIADDLRAIVERKGTYRELLLRTLTGYVDRSLARQDAYVPRSYTTKEQRTKQLADLVSDRCADCHDADDDYAVAPVLKHGAAWCDKTGPECKRIGVEIMNAVMFERMPKDDPFTANDKQRLFDMLAPVLWPEADTREAARQYYVDPAVAPPVHRFDAMTTQIRTAAGNKPAVDLPPPAAEPTFTISIATELAITAARACAGEADKPACLARTLRMKAFEK